jgi:osmotically-inducible protein OsmY
MKGKIASALIALAVAVPLMGVSTAASACHKRCDGYSHYYNKCGTYSKCGHYRHGYYSHSYYKYGYSKNMPLVYRVVRNLRASPATADQPIYVSSRGHRVMLSGYTGTAMQKQAAINITRYTYGVGLVVDNLRTQQP